MILERILFGFVEFCRIVALWNDKVIHQEAIVQTGKRCQESMTHDEFWKDTKILFVLAITNKRCHIEKKRPLCPSFA